MTIKDFDLFLLEETVRDCNDRFKAYLPPDMRPRLDDLAKLHAGLEAINSGLMTDKGMKSFDKAFGRLAAYFRSNPVITKTDV